MIWRLCNYLFGWDYIAWKNTVDNGVARVRNDGNGKTYYCRYPLTKVYDEIKNADQVFWLTCKPEKYINKL